MPTIKRPSILPLHRSIAIITVAVAAPFAVPNAGAANFQWDSDLSIAGAQDGGGTWDTLTNHWFSGGSNVAWADGNDATFGVAADGIFDINVALSPSATSLNFNNTGFNLTATAPQTITVTNSTSSITVASGKTATIGSNVTVSTAAANASYAIAGGGTLIIESGATVINAGTMSSNVLAINSTNVEVKTGGNLSTTAIAGGNGNAIFVNGSLNVTGGTVNAVGTMGIGQSGTQPAGTLTISAGTVNATSSNGLRFGSASASPGGTVNLNGGILRAELISKGAGTVGSSIFNFNGGVLRADASVANFMTNLSRANIRDGGAIIDTNNAIITIAQALEHSNISGDNAIDGGLTKSGAGTLILTGANSYTGATTINGGALRLSNPGALGASSINSNNSGIQLQLANSVTINNEIRLFGGGPNSDGVLKTIDGINTLTNFGVSGGGGTRIHVAAGSTLNLPNAIAIGTNGAAQNFRVIGTGSLFLGADNSAVLSAGTSFLVGVGTAQGPTIQVGNDAAFGASTIDFQPAANAVIAASNPTAHAITNPLKFSDITLNQITFGTAGSGDLAFSGPATLNGNLEATVLNLTTELSGAINGEASLTKSGSGTLVLGGIDANTYTGTTTVSSGVLNVRKDDGLGDGDVIVASGATLKLELGMTNSYISDDGRLLLATGAPIVNLAFTGAADTVAGLSFDGGLTFAAPGIWGSPTSGAQFTSPSFTGPGTLNVVPEPGSAALVLACTTLLGLRRRRP